MALTDRRDEMSLPELIDELYLRFDREVARFEARHREAMEALEFSDDADALYDEADDELREALDDLRDDLRSLLRV